MLRIGLILLLICGSGFSLPAQHDTQRIVGGADNNIENIPWHISLQYNGEHGCGGSILNQNTVLTAAHCVDWNYNIDLYAVRAGSSDRRSGGQYVAAASINVHPNWSYDTIFNDLAIVKLRTNLIYGAGVQSINLPPSGLYVPSPTPMQVSGWGQLASDGPQPYIVQTVVLPMVGMATCQAAYGVTRIDPNIQVCAGEEGRSVCGGDSGGGLIYDNQIIGTVSWGTGCALAGFPGVFTRVSAFREWIDPQL